MTEKQTEKRHDAARGLDLRGDADILNLLARGQAEAAASAREAVPALAQAAGRAAKSLQEGGRLIYVAAGSSGLMTLADALELPGTYGISRERIVVLLAGGMDALVDMKGGPEDDGAAGRQAMLELDPGPADCVIVLTASGQTPYPLEAARAGKAAGAGVVGIANNAGAALFELADIAVLLPTPPEVIAGSTRMGAGTAQKIALNMLSTLMAIRLGHVHDGFMVNLLADNEKLRVRARGMVAAIAEVDAGIAGRALELSGGAVKAAVLIAAGAGTAEAEALLAQNGGYLRPALDSLRGVRQS